MGGKTGTKAVYFDKLKGLLDEYKSIFIVSVDNVSSQQMHEIRQSLRGDAVVLMGKNTMVRRALKGFINDNPEYERLLPHVKGSSALEYTVKITLLTFTGNVGFIFTNGDLKATRDKILSNRVAAPARAGAVAPGDVYIPAGNTGMEPGKTSFFQALGVPTKIARGTIEITTDLKLVEAGAKVGASEATLLNMLNISPFTYGMKVQQVYEEGQSFSPDVLDIEESQLLKALSSAIATITTISLAANYPTLPSVIHSLINGYKKVISVALEVDYSWEAIDELKDRIANPDKYASAAPTAAAASTEAAAPAAAKEEEKEEEKEESDDEGFGGLFD
ncbi:ribosomal protein P0 (A0) (L10E) [Exophiala xenobiotica]|uniref:Large ribosomal subunit protein uL10 n=1 Tax=Vermiconidia calcicola TaxID=1690605 RepID=A0AAV9QBC5_9PEZI|nr:ribosomal protein P0 (A0) (L10E) [Exophiala xenobiotica]KAK5537886.1 ribosomal protein P0 (A0) (L10E) [Vermiconidia calcicola]KAK5301750.1 ribosomal protein P0 (A0) (L10E) [Exophiala xenobiotica]KAK5335269.1 ribosomal protein P0 (A0) (L10E) [Exophiala xenobiotica]KAK5411415.1 ribosomal protein P0 (A0) (L10E) [Exophiala xenobiotica]